MDGSIFLARIIGLMLMIVCSATLFNRKHFPGWMNDVIVHPVLVFIIGIFDVLLGLLIIFTHNIWEFDWRILITLMGWLLLIRGILRLFFPQSIINFIRQQKRQQYDSIILIISSVFFLIGLFLTYQGFKNVLFS
jgi:hypothetical protein